MSTKPAALTLQDCERVYDLPVAQAAQVLGVSRPTIAKVLRRHGIARWPYRKRKAEQRLADWNREHDTSMTRIPRRRRRGRCEVKLERPSPCVSESGSGSLVENDSEVEIDLHGQETKDESREESCVGTLHDDKSYLFRSIDNPGAVFGTGKSEEKWCGVELESMKVEESQESETFDSGVARAVVGGGNWSKGMFHGGDGRAGEISFHFFLDADDREFESSLSFNESEFAEIG